MYVCVYVLVCFMQIRLNYIHSCHCVLSCILPSREESDWALVKYLCPVGPHTAPHGLHVVQSGPAARSVAL